MGVAIRDHPVISGGPNECHLAWPRAGEQVVTEDGNGGPLFLAPIGRRQAEAVAPHRSGRVQVAGDQHTGSTERLQADQRSRPAPFAGAEQPDWPPVPRCVTRRGGGESEAHQQAEGGQAWAGWT